MYQRRRKEKRWKRSKEAAIKRRRASARDECAHLLSLSLSVLTLHHVPSLTLSLGNFPMVNVPLKSCGGIRNGYGDGLDRYNSISGLDSED
jgi:hypothetical protein